MGSTTLLDPVEEAMAALRDPGAATDVADAFHRVTPLLDEVPLPGSGRTDARFAFLARVAEASPALARLVEGHLDGLAILAELATPTPPDLQLGVWAAEPGEFVAAERVPGGWRLAGPKPYASGASELSHALVTARHGRDRLLFLLGAGAWAIRPGTWQAVGMAGSDSPTVDIDAQVADDALLGGPGAYLSRPGFWHGGIGVAAVWHGAAAGVAGALRRAAAKRALPPHAAAHLGGVEVALAVSASMLRDGARAIDDDPLDDAGDAERRARIVRAAVERSATETLDRVGRALGAGPLCHDRMHARRVADLTVYLRQSHAELDLEALGRMVSGA
jgi:alkylation response protein AidB-like acyl-CoA dehydrogenase